jgi:NADH-quinone oxidoreductase subunit C
MTVALSGTEIAARLKEKFADSIVETDTDCLVVKKESLLAIASFIKTAPGLEFDYLSTVTGVDYGDYFELVYHLVSLKHNHSLVIKTRCYQRNEPVVDSVVSLWRAADFQEREIFDLFGISFSGHPNMKRIVLWDGFYGHPLRKDYRHAP